MNIRCDRCGREPDEVAPMLKDVVWQHTARRSGAAAAGANSASVTHPSGLARRGVAIVMQADARTTGIRANEDIAASGTNDRQRVNSSASV